MTDIKTLMLKLSGFYLRALGARSSWSDCSKGSKGGMKLGGVFPKLCLEFLSEAQCAMSNVKSIISGRSNPKLSCPWVWGSPQPKP